MEAVSFETISMDFIFALPGQTFEDLKWDIDMAFSLGANHVAIYPFIDFTFTDSTVTPMPVGNDHILPVAIGAAAAVIATAAILWIILRRKK